MRKFVSSLIYSLMVTFISLVVVYLLQAPLVSFVYYGFFSDSSAISFYTNVIGKTPSVDALTIVILIIQIVLTMGFVIAMFCFISKIINVFLKNEKLIKPYYLVFFFMTLVIPVVLIFISVFLKVKLTILTFVVEGIFMVLNIVLTVFSNKILPETTDIEYRKYLFTEGSVND